MQIHLTAGDYKGRDGYSGAILNLPANQWEIEDARERAHIEKGKSYEIHRFKDWPGAVTFHLILAEEISLEEINFLSSMIPQMSEEEILIFDSALKIRRVSDKDTVMTMKELINTAYNLDKFKFYKEIPDHFMLGEVCLQGDLLDYVSHIPDQYMGLQEKKKIIEVLKEHGNGIFTEKGYLYRFSDDWNEGYDGVNLPGYPEELSILSMLLKNTDETNEDQADDQKSVWITFPSEADRIATALLTLGVQSWKDCVIVEKICAVPALASMITVDTDLLMINELTDAVKSLWDDGDLTMYKAALEYEQCLDCGLALDIALNLACYDFDGYCVSRTEYMKTKFCEGGINISDPAFAFFDFDGYGRRQIGNEGLGYTAYGSIRRNDQPFVRASAEPDSEMSMQL